MPELAVTVLGPDRPGIIAAVTDVLARVGGNLEDTTMTILRGHFTMTLVVSGPASAAEAEQALRPVAERLHLVVSAREVEPEPEPAPAGRTRVLSVHGGDRPGIVAAVT